jgi:hypothetical protein
MSTGTLVARVNTHSVRDMYLKPLIRLRRTPFLAKTLLHV